MLIYVSALLLYFANFSTMASQNLTPQEYSHQAVKIIKNSAFNSERIDWSQINESIINLESMSDAHLLIKVLMAQLGDGYSQFQILPVVTAAIRKPLNSRPQGRFIAGQVAYLTIPSSQTAIVDQRCIQQLSTLVMRMHKKNPIGWIIDLRDCNETTLWTLVAGLSAFIKPSTIGYTTYADGQTEPIVMNCQSIRSDRSVLLNFAAHHKQDKMNKNSMVAILINQKTSHAGLTMAALLAHHAQARIFGPKLGEHVCSFISSHLLADQAYLHLVEGQWQDTQHQPLVFKVDEVIPFSEDNSAHALNAAIDWMLTAIEQQIKQAEFNPFKD